MISLHIDARLFMLIGLLLAAAPIASASIIWNEMVRGDFSDDRFLPTTITLDLGENTIIGSVVAVDRDFFTMIVPPGMQLSQLVLRDYLSSDDLAFIGVQAGATLTVDPDAPSAADLLGYALFGTGAEPIGTDYLPAMGSAGGAIGFSPPLPSGVYAFWLQQLGTSTLYSWDFVVTPEPSGLTVLAVGALLLTRRRGA